MNPTWIRLCTTWWTPSRSSSSGGMCSAPGSAGFRQEKKADRPLSGYVVEPDFLASVDSLPC